MRRTIAAGEFQRLPRRRELAADHVSDILEAEQRWRSERSRLAAAEFAGASLIAGDLERAAEAARFIADDANEFYRSLASRVLGRDPTVTYTRVGQLDTHRVDVEFRLKVAEAKNRVNRDPRNAIAWGDLARRYTALGQVGKAERALGIARVLAPTSRYLMRSMARFLVHVGRADEALGLLQGSPRTRQDPWLMAASLSVAGAGKLPVKGVRDARRIIDQGNFRAIEFAELESELGTLELRSGADRKARALFNRSLQAPTDNSLAQVEWASHRLPQMEVPLDSFEVPFVAEALSRSAAEDGDWHAALQHSIEWIDDQPFDAQAAIHASYIASVGLEEWDTSVLLAELGLRANPADFTLLNNMAYGLIELGELDRAKGYLDRATGRQGERAERVALYATRGLLHFRQGDAAGGRTLYREAIEVARRAGESDAEAMARSMLIREEVSVAGVAGLDAALVDAIASVVDQVKDSGVRRCVERALRLVGLKDR